jgi:hypothetical protein
MKKIDLRRWRRLRELLSAPALATLAENETARVIQPWDQMTDEDIVRSLLVQIAVIGNALTGYRFAQALRERGVVNRLVKNITARVPTLHATARRCGVRFVGADLPSPKVTAWAAVLQHPCVVKGRRLHVRSQIETVIRTVSVSGPERDRQIRDDLLAWGMPMIGRKSWSDWLNNRGLTRHLLAIDTRLVGVWNRELGAAIKLEDFQDATVYADWESACEKHLAEPLGITLSDLDKRLFMLPTIHR